MLKNLVFAALKNFDKDNLFIESLGDNIVLNDFTVKVDGTFIILQGNEWDREWEEKMENIVKFKINSSELTDFEDLSSPGCDFIALGINNGMGFIEMYDCY